MLLPIDAAPGETYVFRVRPRNFTAKYVKSKSNGDLVFERTDGSGRWHLDRKSYIFMRCRGQAAKLDTHEGSLEITAVEPGAFEPERPGDSRSVKARKKAHFKATIQQYYVMCMDEFSIPASNLPLAGFIAGHEHTHKMLFGKDAKAPGTSTLIRLARECGEKYFRPFAFFLNGSGGDRRSGLWCDFVRLHKQAMISWYWSPKRPSPRAVKSWFKGEIAKERNRRLALELGDPAGDEMRRLRDTAGGATESGLLVLAPDIPALRADKLFDATDLDPGFASPTDSTLQNWIDREASLANIASREGRTVANRQVEGIHPHVTALRPLECVVMDHTQIDLHVVVYDEKGKITAETFRPWLIVVIDVYSRMVLAARLSIEPPSLYTLYAGLKQTLKPKDFLQHLDTKSAYFWALDGFGKFKRMLVDNDLANIGRSMRSTAASVGLNVSFAPVKTPTYKSIVERFFKTLNTSLWHEADGGVPEKPGVLKSDPRENARFTLIRAQELLWHWIITVYHLDVHDELDVPPALKWKEAHETYFRPLVDDMDVIDAAFGRSGVRTLTTSGVEYRREIFNHPEVTTGLLDDLCHLSATPRGTPKMNNTRSVEIELTEYETVAKIFVYNYARGVHCELPNEDPERTGTYEDAVVERAGRNVKTEEFFSRNDLDLNKAAIAAQLTINSPPVVDTRTSHASAPSDSSSQASGAGDDHSSLRTPAARRRDQNVVQRPGVKRRKSVKSKVAAEWEDAGPIIEHEPPVTSVVPSAADAAENVETLAPSARFRVTDENAFLERMKAQLKVSRQ
ncbi:transposase [Rhizobium ruizarguesonis]|uniref:DDE-type integrase/transposase/recombinase n=1 Tax=Rhizobium ruizarguesonis TaxID=2081791 RepID=UPI00102FB949|nr:DDE-type integrase/transposase/recombinase [Rhizobium ruizarguesonis]TAZ19507.1 transposase [Rhizobium ruizarguesonis]